ncbi:flagellar hook-basal body complex protein FliE [Sphingomonas sp. RP10(2022)]|uniref:Flagellar hook-basal body complex protein FliE n=1 Tax=Sphingomonas liriopis TaxID=2949094 RepID=A0A9X2HR85_9SPHN|nr:flagellar hook-basal body complex protein FliE [Sphingomonas liriopis]MCP3734987.1 flagellar hook-basal body complex protein FliE [Sphingomonas liriopis]
MSGVSGVGGAMSVDRVMQLRAQILERNQSLARAGASDGAAATNATGTTKPTSFADTLQDALKDVNSSQNKASALSESYERGETVDIAKVMLARQQASVGFEATLQVRNKLLSAYKDIMSMPV